MKVDLRIIGGTLVDPARGLHGTGEVLIRGNTIVSAAQNETVEAAKTINAEGSLVFPGLIDFHAHLHALGTEGGVPPDISFLPMGVTTAVDAGSCGSANYDSFVRTVVPMSKTRIFSFLNVCSAGLVAPRYPEELNPKYYDEHVMAELFARNRGQLLGLKVRVSKELVGELGIKPLSSTLEIAQRLNCPVVVHTTNPVVSPDEIATMLRPGDVYCHVHQGTGTTVVGANGKVSQALYKAQKAGLIFDASNGRKNFSFPVASAALADGFFPDIISSDVTKATSYGDFVFALPYVMMKYLNMGMDLDRVVAACTSTPAAQLGMQGKLGTLAPGAFADVAVFRSATKPVAMKDTFGNPMTGDKWLLPQLTVLNGSIAYRQIDF